jgi:hypothetical protein
MSYKSKHVLILIALLIMAFSCASQRKKKTATNIDLYQINAFYFPYVTAMGKGKGIVFRNIITNTNDSNFTIEKYYLNNKPLEFTTIKQKGVLIVEANYLVNTLTTNFLDKNNLPTTKEIDDPIIVDQKFYPSWVIINTKNGKIKLDIDNYKTQK